MTSLTVGLEDSMPAEPRAMVSARTKFLKQLLMFGGLWMESDEKRLMLPLSLFQWIRYLYLLAGLVVMLYSLVLNGLAFLLTPTAVFIPLGLNIIATSGVVVANLKSLETLVAESERNISSYEEVWEKELIEEQTNLLRRVANLINYSLCLFGSTYMVLPFLIDACLTRPEPYDVPLPFDRFFAANRTRTAGYYAIVLCSDVWFLFAVPNTAAFECLIFCIVSFSASEIDIAIKHLRMTKTLRDNTLKTDLHHIIKKHQQIVRLNQLQKKHITPAYVCQIVFSALSICFTMFLVDQTLGKDSLVTLLGVIFILILLTVNFLMCYSGEYLEEIGNRLNFEIYDLAWYDQSPSVRKDILLMLTQTSKNLVLEYASCFSLNLNTYSQIVNTAYSYYMLMKSVS